MWVLQKASKLAKRNETYPEQDSNGVSSTNGVMRLGEVGRESIRVLLLDERHSSPVQPLDLLEDRRSGTGTAAFAVLVVEARAPA